MCTGVEPWVIAAISGAATVAGTASQISANKKREAATNRAASEELTRKAKTNQEAQAIFNAELENQNVGDANKDVDAAAAQQEAETQRLLNRPEQETGFESAMDAPGMAQSSSPVVKEVAARTLADELAKTEAQMKAASTLQGYAERTRARGTQFGRAAEQMGLLGNFNQGWGQVGQVQSQLAQNAGGKQALLGDALTGLGHMGMSYYGATSGAGAAKAAGSTPTVLSSGGGTNPYGYVSQIPGRYQQPTASAMGSKYFM